MDSRTFTSEDDLRNMAAYGPQPQVTAPPGSTRAAIEHQAGEVRGWLEHCRDLSDRAEEAHRKLEVAVKPEDLEAAAAQLSNQARTAEKESMKELARISTEELHLLNDRLVSGTALEVRRSRREAQINRLVAMPVEDRHRAFSRALEDGDEHLVESVASATRQDLARLALPEDLVGIARTSLLRVRAGGKAAEELSARRVAVRHLGNEGLRATRLASKLRDLAHRAQQIPEDRARRDELAGKN